MPLVLGPMASTNINFQPFSGKKVQKVNLAQKFKNSNFDQNQTAYIGGMNFGNERSRSNLPA